MLTAMTEDVDRLRGLAMRAFSRTQLIEACLPQSDAEDRVVDSHIFNLRRKLEAAGIKNYIAAVRGVGYRLLA